MLASKIKQLLDPYLTGGDLHSSSPLQIHGTRMRAGSALLQLVQSYLPSGISCHEIHCRTLQIDISPLGALFRSTTSPGVHVRLQGIRFVISCEEDFLGTSHFLEFELLRLAAERQVVTDGLYEDKEDTAWGRMIKALIAKLASYNVELELCDARIEWEIKGWVGGVIARREDAEGLGGGDGDHGRKMKEGVREDGGNGRLDGVEEGLIGRKNNAIAGKENEGFGSRMGEDDNGRDTHGLMLGIGEQGDGSEMNEIVEGKGTGGEIMSSEGFDKKMKLEKGNVGKSNESGILVVKIDRIAISSTNDDPAEAYVQGTGVLRKAVVVENVKVAWEEERIRECTLLHCPAVEIVLAMSLSSASNGLCTAVQIRLSDVNFGVDKWTQTRMQRVGMEMEKGTSLAKRGMENLKTSLKMFRISTEDENRALTAYVRILQSDDPTTDVDLGTMHPDSMTISGPGGRQFSWLEMIELVAGDVKRTKWLVQAREVVRNQRLAKTKQLVNEGNLPTKSSWWGGFGRSANTNDANAPTNAEKQQSNALLMHGGLATDDPVRMKAVFAALDADGSGSISVDELQSGLEAYGLNLGSNRIYALLKEFDVNQDDAIEFSEFSEFCKRIVRDLQTDKPLEVKIQIFIQAVSVAFENPITELTMLVARLNHVQFTLFNRGMPFSKRHDFSIGSKELTACIGMVSIKAIEKCREDIFIMAGTSRSVKNARHAGGGVVDDLPPTRTHAKISFVEFVPAAKEFDFTPDSNVIGICLDDDPESWLAMSIQERSGRGGGTLKEEPCMAADLIAQPLTASSPAKQQSKASVFRMRRHKPYETEVLEGESWSFDIVKNPRVKGFVGKFVSDLFSQSSSSADAMSDNALGVAELALSLPPASSVHFANSGVAKSTFHRWIPVTKTTMASDRRSESTTIVGHLFLRVALETRFVMQDGFVRKSPNLVLQHQDDFACFLKLKFIPGLWVSDLSANLAIAPFQAKIDLSIVNPLLDVVNDLLASPPPPARPPLQSFSSATLLSEAVVVMLPLPGDTAGFSHYDNQNRWIPPTNVRSTLSMSLFGEESDVVRVRPGIVNFDEHSMQSCFVHCMRSSKAHSGIRIVLQPICIAFTSNDGGAGDDFILNVSPPANQRASSSDYAESRTTTLSRSETQDTFVTALDSQTPHEDMAILQPPMQDHFSQSVLIQMTCPLAFSVFETSGLHDIHALTVEASGLHCSAEAKGDRVSAAVTLSAGMTITEVQILDHDLQPMICRHIKANKRTHAEKKGLKNHVVLTAGYSEDDTFVKFDVHGMAVLATPLVRVLNQTIPRVMNSFYGDEGTGDTRSTLSESTSSNTAAELDHDDEHVAMDNTQVQSTPPFDIRTAMVLPTKSIFFSFDLHGLDIHVLEKAFCEATADVMHTVSVRSDIFMSFGAKASPMDGIPAFEITKIKLSPEIVRYDLMHPDRFPNTLVEKFDLNATIDLSRGQKVSSTTNPNTMRTVAETVEYMMANPVVLAVDSGPVNADDVFQHVFVGINGLNMKFDTNDYRFILSALNLLSSFSEQPRGKASSTTFVGPVVVESSVPSPMAIADSQVSPKSVFFTTFVYPTLALSLEPRVMTNATQPNVAVEALRHRVHDNFTKAGARLVDQTALLDFRNIAVGVGIVGVSGFAHPFLRGGISEAWIALTNESFSWFLQDVNGHGRLALDISTHNRVSQMWEPLIEPWSVFFRAKKTTSGDTMAVATAAYRMNINITESVMTSFSNFSKFTDLETRSPQDDARLKGSYCPNWIINETGETGVKVWAVRSDLSSKNATNECVVLDGGQVSPFHLRDRRSLYEMGNRVVDMAVSTAMRREHRVLDRKQVLSMWFRSVMDEECRVGASQMQRALADRHEIVSRAQLEYELGVATGRGIFANSQEHFKSPSSSDVDALKKTLNQQVVASADEKAVTVNEKEFVSFFSDPYQQDLSKFPDEDGVTDDNGANKFEKFEDGVVQKLGVQFSNLDAFSEDVFFAPHANAGDCLLGSANLCNQLVGISSRMGRFNISSVLKLETTLKFENRMTTTVQIGYFGPEVGFDIKASSVMQTSSMSFLQSLSSSFKSRSGNDVTNSLSIPYPPQPKSSNEGSNIFLGDSAEASAKVFRAVLELEPGASKLIPLRFLCDPSNTFDFVVHVPKESPGVYSPVLVTTTRTGASEFGDGSILQTPRALTFADAKNPTETSKKRFVRADPLAIGNVCLCAMESALPLSSFETKRVLVVQVVSARGLISTMFDVPDPFVRVETSTEKFETPVIQNDIDPIWKSEDATTFRLGQGRDTKFPDEIVVSILDYDALSSADLLGKVSIDVKSLLGEIEQREGSGSIATRTYKFSSSGSITLSFIYQPATEVSLSVPISQHIVSLSPSLIVENLLPFALDFKLENSQGKVFSARIGSGRMMNPPLCFNGADLGSTNLLVNIRKADPFGQGNDGALGWVQVDHFRNEPFSLETGNDSGFVVVDTDLTRDVCRDYGSRRLTFFADCWVANKSFLELSFETPGRAKSMTVVAATFLSPSTSDTLGRRTTRTQFFPPKEICCLCVPQVKGKRDLIVRAREWCNVSAPNVQSVSSPAAAMAVSQPSPTTATKAKTSLKISSRLSSEADQVTTSVTTSRVEMVATDPSSMSPMPLPLAIDLEQQMGITSMITLRPERNFNFASAAATAMSSTAAKMDHRPVGRIIVVFDSLIQNCRVVVELRSRRNPVLVIHGTRLNDHAYVLLEHLADEDSFKKHTFWGLDDSILEIGFVDESQEKFSKTLGLSSYFPAWGVKHEFYESIGMADPTSSTTMPGNVASAFSVIRYGLEPAINTGFTNMTLSASSNSEQLAMQVSALRGKWFRTSVVTFSPPLLVACEAGLLILAKRLGAPDDQAVLLHPLARRMRVSESDSVQFRSLKTKRARWTRPIRVNGEVDFAVQLRDENGQRIERFVFDTNWLSGSRCIVARHCPDDLIEVVIKNESKRKLWIRQAMRSRKTSLLAKLKCLQFSRGEASGEHTIPYDVMEPQSFLPFAFDMFDHSPRSPLLEISLTTTQKHLCKLRAGFRLREPGLHVSVDFHGNHLVVVVSDPLSPFPGGAIKPSTRWKPSVTAAASPIGQRIGGGSNFCIHLSGIGISLFSTFQKHEVGYALIQRIHVEISMESQAIENPVSNKTSNWTSTKLDVSIGNVQIDSSVVTGKNPVPLSVVVNAHKRKGEEGHFRLDVLSPEMLAWAPQECGTQAARERRFELDVIRVMTHTASPVSNPEASVIRYMGVHIRDLDARVDGAFLAAVLSIFFPPALMARSLTSNANAMELSESSENNSHQAQDLINSLFKDAVQLPPRDSSFVEFAEFSECRYCVSVDIGSPKDLISLTQQYGISATTMALISRLSRLETFNFDINRNEYVTTGSEKIVPRYSDFLMKALWGQLGEFFLNFSKRMAIDVGLIRGSREVEKVRRPPIPGPLVIYGPGRFPHFEELLIEFRAVRTIERWWIRRKRRFDSGPRNTVSQGAKLEQQQANPVPVTGKSKKASWRRVWGCI